MGQLATNCKDSVFQYCNYGYDKTLYSSYEDCMSKEMQKCNTSGEAKGGGGGVNTNEESNGCNSGSLGLGGLGVLLKPRCWNNEIKLTAIIGGALAIYYILHKKGVLK